MTEIRIDHSHRVVAHSGKERELFFFTDIGVRAVFLFMVAVLSIMNVLFSEELSTAIATFIFYGSKTIKGQSVQTL